VAHGDCSLSGTSSQVAVPAAEIHCSIDCRACGVVHLPEGTDVGVVLPHGCVTLEGGWLVRIDNNVPFPCQPAFALMQPCTI
jgi:hypothetical protein